MIPSLEASQHLRATKLSCSWQAGWRSLLLRAYEDAPLAEEFTTAATPDQLFILVTSGSCQIESRLRGRWYKDRHTVGNLAMTAPGETARIRWQSDEPHRTLQLHLPRSTIAKQLEQHWDRDIGLMTLPSVLSSRDPVVETMMLALQQGLDQGFPDLYAETAAEFLTAHLLLRHCDLKSKGAAEGDNRRLRHIHAYMQDNFGAPVSLATLAAESGLSRFHLLRLFKKAYGETPLKQLTRIRMEEAKRRLLRTGQSITEIALDCGYENPAHFATAFRRIEGVTPSAYRRAR